MLVFSNGRDVRVQDTLVLTTTEPIISIRTTRVEYARSACLVVLTRHTLHYLTIKLGGGQPQHIESIDTKMVNFPPGLFGLSIVCYWDDNCDVALIDRNREYYTVRAYALVAQGLRYAVKLGRNVHRTINMSSIACVSADRQSLVFPGKGSLNVRRVMEYQGTDFLITDITYAMPAAQDAYSNRYGTVYDYLILVLTNKGVAILRYGTNYENQYHNYEEVITRHDNVSYLGMIQDDGFMSVAGSRLVLARRFLVPVLVGGQVDIPPLDEDNDDSVDVLEYLSSGGSEDEIDMIEVVGYLASLYWEGPIRVHDNGYIDDPANDDSWIEDWDAINPDSYGMVNAPDTPLPVSSMGS